MASTLYGVSSASLVLSDGTVVEASTNGSTTLTLSQIAPPPSTTSTTIATIVLGTGATTFAVPVGVSTVALASRVNADGTEDVFVLGPRGGSALHLLAIHFQRSAAGVWSELGRRAVQLPAPASGTAAAISSLAVGYYAAPKGTPSLFVLGRRDQPRNASGVFYATLDPRGIASTAFVLTLKSGDAPSWLPALAPTTAAALPPVDVAKLSNGSFAIFVDQEGVVDVLGDGTVVSRYRSGTTMTLTALRARVVALGGDVFASVFGSETLADLTLVVRNVSGSLIARRSIPTPDVLAGGMGAKWDVYYNPVADELVVYYVAATTRTIRRIVVPMTTLVVGAAATVSSLAGTGGTIGVLRVQREAPDERRARIGLAQTLTGVESYQTLLDTSRNVAPLAPALYFDGASLDATNPIILSWVFGDSNPRDRQTAYDLEVQRVSDLVNVVSAVNVTSTTASRVIAGGTLANGVAYRYRVRTKDALGTYGAWSSYSANFTPLSNGTVTITSPAADDPAGLNTATVPIAWTASIPGATPEEWELRVYIVATGTLYHSAGSATSYASSYNAPVPTDQRVRIEVNAVSSAGTSSTATRYLTSSYSLPMEATPTVVLDPTGSAARVSWVVPAIAGARPVTEAFVVERLDPGAAAFVGRYLVETPGGLPAGTELYVDDAEIASGEVYTYRVASIAASGAESRAAGVELEATVQLMGAWLHAVDDPTGSLRGFPYAEGRKVGRSVESESIPLIGRDFPVVEFGDAELASLSMAVRIPHGLGDDPDVEWWRDALRQRRTLCYRDNRQRLAYCVVQGFTENDTADGSVVDVTLEQVPFVREVTDATA